MHGINHYPFILKKWFTSMALSLFLIENNFVYKHFTPVISLKRMLTDIINAFSRFSLWVTSLLVLVEIVLWKNDCSFLSHKSFSLGLFPHFHKGTEAVTEKTIDLKADKTSNDIHEETRTEEVIWFTLCHLIMNYIRT